MFFSINTFYVLAAFNKNANQLQISAKGGILFIIVIVYHVTKPRGNRVSLPLPWTWFSFYPHTYVHKCTCGHYCGILGINEPYSSCTGSSIAKCGRVNQYFNKFWWILYKWVICYRIGKISNKKWVYWFKHWFTSLHFAMNDPVSTHYSSKAIVS